MHSHLNFIVSIEKELIFIHLIFFTHFVSPKSPKREMWELIKFL